MTSAQRAVGLDTRSLALARLLLAVALLWHVSGAAVAWPVAARVGAALAALALLLGARTTAAAALGYISLASGYVMTDFVAADTLLLILLLLGACLPLATHLSVDAALDTANAPSTTTLTAPPAPMTLVSMATITLTLTLVLILFMSAESTFLAGVSWRHAGIANLLAIAAPLLILAPIPGGAVRTLTLLALIAGVALFTPGLYGGVSKLSLCAGLCALLPAAPWRWLLRIRRLRPPTGVHVYYDRDCGFCRKTCYLFRSFMLLGATPITPAQSEAQIYAIMQRDNTWVVTDRDGGWHTRWRAVLFLLRRSPLWWPLGLTLSALGMGRWGDPLYAGIAATRHHWSKLTAVALPYRHERWLRGAPVTAALAVWLTLALIFSVLHIDRIVPAGSVATTVLRALGIGYPWNLW